MTDDEFREALESNRQERGLNPKTGEPIHVVHLAWSRGGEFFAMSIQRGYEREALRTLGRWAGDPELPIGWCDAANISNQIRRAFR